MKKQIHPRRYVSTPCLRGLLLFFIFSLLIIVPAQAQQQTYTTFLPVPERKPFLEVKLSAMPYEAVGSPKYHRMHGLGLPFISLHFGYRLSERATVKVGLGYGFNDVSMGGTARIISIDSIYHERHFYRISAIAVPFMLRYTPFNPNKRFQIYGNFSLTPIYRHIEAQASESLQGIYEDRKLYDDESSGFTLVAMAGVTANYRLSKKLSVFADCSISYFNFAYENPQSFRNGAKGIGISYHL